MLYNMYTLLGPRKFRLDYWTYVFIMTCDQLNIVAVSGLIKHVGRCTKYT